MAGRGASVNLGSFVGASTVRMYAKGMAQGLATAAELDSMRMVVRQAMEDGAFGIASALIYPPGNYASTEELVEISKAMAPFGGVYITHMRSEADAWLPAIDEALRIGREARVPVEIYHLKAGGRRNWHKTSVAIAKIDSARAAGTGRAEPTCTPTSPAEPASRPACPPWALGGQQALQQPQGPRHAREVAPRWTGSRMNGKRSASSPTPSGVWSWASTSRRQAVRGSAWARCPGDEQEWQETVMDLLISEEQRIARCTS
jgi:dihydroorotase/N-acyl-D-amino-acid deacylase